MKSRSLLIAACELKRSYQMNLAIGFGISGFVMLGMVILAGMFSSCASEQAIPTSPVDTTVIDFYVPPIVHEPPPKPSDTKRPVNVPEIGGIVEGMADSLVKEPKTIQTQDQLAGLVSATPLSDSADNVKIDTSRVMDTLLPTRGTPSFWDIPPAVISSVQPEYPDLARRTGLEGKVWLEVLVDKDGNVRDVFVAKCDNKDVGFEDAAMAAAWKSVWKPAISNGLPIAVRVTYAVVFKLK